MQFFLFVDFAVIEIRLFNRKKKQKKMKMNNSVKIEITSITPVFQPFLDFFFRYQQVPHFGDGISQIEWKLKEKT